MNPARPNERISGPQMTQMGADSQSSQNDLRKSASSADDFSPIRPRAIEVHIEELVLHGFQPNDHWRIGDALENELRELLTRQGLPAAWQSNPERLDAGLISLTNKAEAGASLAQAVYRGGAPQ